MSICCTCNPSQWPRCAVRQQLQTQQPAATCCRRLHQILQRRNSRGGGSTAEASIRQHWHGMSHTRQGMQICLQKPHITPHHTRPAPSGHGSMVCAHNSAVTTSSMAPVVCSCPGSHVMLHLRSSTPHCSHVPSATSRTSAPGSPPHCQQAPWSTEQCDPAHQQHMLQASYQAYVARLESSRRQCSASNTGKAVVSRKHVRTSEVSYAMLSCKAAGCISG
jgi:hypothetical protein